MKKEFMERAIELSRKNMKTNAGGPFGAVVVKDGQIVGEGWNKVTSTNDPTAHAEVEAIRQAATKIKNFDLSGCVIYTSCEPCPMCLAAIYWARITTVYYGNTRADAAAIAFDDDIIYQELNKDMSQRSVLMKQMMHPEAQTVFEEWKNKLDKIEY